VIAVEVAALALLKIPTWFKKRAQNQVHHDVDDHVVRPTS
jgi:hypothetical protein